MSAEHRNVPAVIETAAPARASSLRDTLTVPAAIANAGDNAARRFLEFFCRQHSQQGYPAGLLPGRALVPRLVEQHRIGELADIEPVHVAAYIEALQTTAVKPTVKQQPAGLVGDAGRRRSSRRSVPFFARSAAIGSLSKNSVCAAVDLSPMTHFDRARARSRPARLAIAALPLAAILAAVKFTVFCQRRSKAT